MIKIGDNVNNWKIISPDSIKSGKRKFFICECKCGKRLSKRSDELKRIKQCKSCATKARDFGKLSPFPLKDLKGQKFGKWNVIEHISNEKRGGFWKCQCECGTISIIFGGELRRGKSKQCKNCVNHRHFTHRMATRGKIAPEYRCWAAIKTRCYNEKSKRYSQWGGRGISVFPDWIESFEKFYEYIGPKPTPKHSIDRIDVNGNYEPGNVRWATPKEQSNNRRKRKP